MGSRRKRVVAISLMAAAGVILLGADRLLVSADSGDSIKTIGIAAFIGLWLLVMAIIWFSWTT